MGNQRGALDVGNQKELLTELGPVCGDLGEGLGKHPSALDWRFKET